MLGEKRWAHHDVVEFGFDQLRWDDLTRLGPVDATFATEDLGTSSTSTALSFTALASGPVSPEKVSLSQPGVAKWLECG